MTRLIALVAVLVALSVPALASANPRPWTDKNNADATVCSTYGRDGTQKNGLAYLERSLEGKVTRARIFVTDGADVGKKLNRSFTVRIKR